MCIRDSEQTITRLSDDQQDLASENRRMRDENAYLRSRSQPPSTAPPPSAAPRAPPPGYMVPPPPPGPVHDYHNAPPQPHQSNYSNGNGHGNSTGWGHVNSYTDPSVCNLGYAHSSHGSAGASSQDEGESKEERRERKERRAKKKRREEHERALKRNMDVLGGLVTA